MYVLITRDKVFGVLGVLCLGLGCWCARYLCATLDQSCVCIQLLHCCINSIVSSLHGQESFRRSCILYAVSKLDYISFERLCASIMFLFLGIITKKTSFGKEIHQQSVLSKNNICPLQNIILYGIFVVH